MTSQFSIVFRIPQDPGRRQPEDVNQEMIDKANSFYQAGSRCVADFSLSPNITNSLTSPAILCYVFSIELYLKLLLRLNGVDFERIHNLLDLFSALPSNVKEVVIQKFEVADFVDEITRVSNAFIECRYDYENTDFSALSTSMLAQIGRALHNTAMDINDDLRITFENRLAI